MSEQTGKLKNKIKAVFAELRQFEEYVDAYLKETSFQIFTVKETLFALVEHLGCAAQVAEIISKHQEEAEKEKERLKVEIEEKRRAREAEAAKVHEAMGSDGMPNAN